MQGEEYTQQTYCQRANAFKQQWLQTHPEVNNALQAAIQVSRDMSALYVWVGTFLTHDPV